MIVTKVDSFHTWEAELPPDVQKKIGYKQEIKEGFNYIEGTRAKSWALKIAVSVWDENGSIWNKKAQNRYIEVIRDDNLIAFYTMKMEFENEK